jgi:hypothetical protein
MVTREPRTAWVLNLDADLELAALGSPYAPSRSVLDATRAWSALLVGAAALVEPGDVIVDERTPSNAARGCLGRAFCPTPRALALLERAGAEPAPHPPASVLREVNGRAFCAALGPTLPGGVFVFAADEVRAALASAPPSGFDAWRVKRAFGMAGRGQRVIAPGAFTEDDARFLRSCLARGDGVRIEPDARIIAEYALHGMLEPDGALELGAIVMQRSDARGAWVDTTRLAPHERDALPFASALADEARRVARALHEAGYFGPFGIDAFTYDDGTGREVLNPRSEINARYSMGFTAGFGAIR